MTENTPDAVRLATDFARRLRANADRAEKDKFTVANLSTMSVDGCRALADWIGDAAEFLGARAMQAAMAAPAGVREDYAAICKELGCIEKPGVPLRFIQEMRKNLTAASERIDWLLRSWDDATITERQELDRMRRGWGPTTPTERMLRHRDLRDCMQALSGALTDLTTPEDESADPEVEARLQEVYDRVNRRYLASLEILRRLDDPLVRPDLEPAGAREGAEDQQPSGAVWGRAAREASAKTPDILVDVVNAELAKREPTPAPDVPGLVATLRRGTGIRESVLYTEADAYAADRTMKEAADALEALQAEVAKRGRIASDLQALCDRQAIELGALRSEQSDLRYEIMEGRPDPGLAKGNFIEMVRMLHGAQKGGLARATAAEAERDALKAEVERMKERSAEHEARFDAESSRADHYKAEVERKDKALREAGEAIAEYFRYLNGGEMRGSYDGKPEREGLRKAGYAVSRALSPAKAGG